MAVWDTGVTRRVAWCLVFLINGVVLSNAYTGIVLKTCAGCALANYPEVVKFIKYDLPNFDKSLI